MKRWRKVKRSRFAQLEHAKSKLDLVGPRRRRRLRNQIARLEAQRSGWERAPSFVDWPRRVEIPFSDVVGVLWRPTDV